MKKILLSAVMLGITLLSIVFGQMEMFAETCEDVQTQELRLHLPANSDSDAEQARNLELRDFLLSEYGHILSHCGDLNSAESKCKALLPEIESKCNEFLKAHGADYGAKAELTEMYFTTREYDRLILPAGNYKALRVTLGSGEGHNWWCVIFPQLCLPAASEITEPNAVLDSFGKPQKITVKFALYEWLKQLFSA